MKPLFIRRTIKAIMKNHLFSFLSAGLILFMSVQSHAVAQTVQLAKSAPAAVERNLLPEQFIAQTGVSKLDVTLGKSTLLKLPQAIKRISVGSPSVADVMMISAREVYILGKIVGMTNITLWTQDGKSTVIDVTVLMDVTALNHQLQAIMPDEKDIKITAAGDSLIVSGFVTNTLKADRAIALADAFVRTSVLNMMMNLQSGQSASGEQSGSGGQGGGMQGMQMLRQGMQNDPDSPGAGAGLGNFKAP